MKSFLLFALFALAPFAYADTNISNNWDDVTYDNFVPVFLGSVNTTYIPIGNDRLLTEVKQKVCSVQAPDDNYRISVRLVSDFSLVGVSNNSFDSTTISNLCGSPTEVIFNLNIELVEGTEYYIGIESIENTDGPFKGYVNVHISDDVSILDSYVNNHLGGIEILYPGQWLGTINFQTLQYDIYFFSGIIEIIILAFIGLFITVFGFMVTYMWFYLIGLAIILLVYKKAKGLLRI